MHLHKHLCGLAMGLIIGLAASSAKADNEYWVEKGDTLYGIGQLLGVPWKEIMKVNGLKTTTIFPDQILVIPSAGKTVEQDMFATATQSKPIHTIEAPTPIEIPESINVPVYAKVSSKQVTYKAQNDPRVAYVPSIQGRSKSRPGMSAPMAMPETYVVQAGDSVWSISRKFGISAWDLRKANNIKYSSIKVGQKLNLPARPTEVSIAAN